MMSCQRLKKSSELGDIRPRWCSGLSCSPVEAATRVQIPVGAPIIFDVIMSCFCSYYRGTGRRNLPKLERILKETLLYPIPSP